MANLTNFGNGTLSINTSFLNNPETIIQTAATNADTATNGVFSLVMFILVYIFLTYELTKDNGMFRLDIIKSSNIASGFVLIIGAVLLIAEFTNAFYILVWFGVIFLIGLIIEFNKKDRGG